MPGDMTGLRTAHTADLDAGARSAIRSLMDAAFGAVSDDTFDNVLGGVHALLLEDGELIGHGSVIQRRLLPARRARRQHRGRPALRRTRVAAVAGAVLGPDAGRHQAHRG